MSSLSRWDPVRESTSLRDAMNQLFEQAVMRPSFLSAISGYSTVGQMNVLETEGQYLVQILLPGIRPESVDLTVRQNTLSLKASLAEPFTKEQLAKSTYLVREFGAGDFNRQVTFPKDVDGDNVQAHFERGVLTLAIPFAQHAQPKRITINEVNGAPSPTNYVTETGAKREAAQIN